jgi:5-methylcytosine-specific restriction endonuclease McrA
MAAKKLYSDEELREHKNARTAQRYRENRDRINAYHAALHQSRKDDPEYMRKLREKSAKWRAANPEKVKESARKTKAKHAEKRRAEVREWFAANPERRAAYEQNRRALKRKATGKLSPDIKGKLFSLQMGRCACCREKFKMHELHLDHIHPLSGGGEHIDKNMQLLCQPCNQSKYAKHPVDFMRERGYLL